MAELPLITSEDFAALASEWAEFWAAAPGATPFHHPEWHAAWLRHFGRESAPVFLSVRDGERLVGVAALDLDRDQARELGDHNVRDYAGPLSLPGFEGAVAAGILEWLREDLTPNATFWGVIENSAMRAALEAAGEAGGWRVESTAEAVCPEVELPRDFEAFVAGLTKHDRHELRRKIRNLEAAGAVTFDYATSPEEVGGAIDTLFRLMRASREDKGEFLTPVMEAFLRDLGDVFSRVGILRLATMRLDEVAVASTLCFEAGGCTYLYNSGYAPEYSKLAVGLVSKARAISDAIGRGQVRFDFLRGNEDYKANLGGSPRDLVTLRLTS